MTAIETAAPPRPPASTGGLGELIRSYRLYLGLSQRAMAEQLGKARRDYQRIENGQDRCPAGLLSAIEALTDRFDDQVDRILNAVVENGGAVLSVDTDNEWDRSIVGRAAVEAAMDDDLPTITIHRHDTNERIG